MYRSSAARRSDATVRLTASRSSRTPTGDHSRRPPPMGRLTWIVLFVSLFIHGTGAQ
ncbi:hypothetical protein NHX12_024663, partial [Muraenolepis orangiensis]